MAVTNVANAQILTPLELLTIDRPLQKAEIVRVLDAVRTAMAGKVFRLRHFPDAEWLRGLLVLIGSRGNSSYLSWETELQRPTAWERVGH
jgi:hypothetical protein